MQTIERGVTVDTLHDSFQLNADGTLVRKRRIKVSGRLASGDRYLRVRVGGRLFLTHRVVFAMTHGRWPDGQLDHVNRDKLDNRPENLREVSGSDNCKNKDWARIAEVHAKNMQVRKLSQNNTTGVRGVVKKGGCFVAQINLFAQRIRLGNHRDLDLAALIRAEAERVATTQPWRLLQCA